jgi:hypothetical protein
VRGVAAEFWIANNRMEKSAEAPAVFLVAARDSCRPPRESLSRPITRYCVIDPTLRAIKPSFLDTHGIFSFPAT